MDDLKMPKPKSGFACVSINTVIGIPGLCSASPIKGISPRISSKKNESKQRIFIIGGNDGKVQDSVQVLEFPSCTWVEAKPMLHKRDELAACLGPDNKIYVVGGYGGTDNNCLRSAERYDLELDEAENC